MPLNPQNLTPEEFIEAARNVRQTFYWEKKDLATYVVLTKHLLATAIHNHKSNGEYSEEFGNRVMGLGYDLASMTWPGWDEDGIEMTEALRQTGLKAANLIVEFATIKGTTDEHLHDLYWMQGAHFLTDGKSEEAKAAWQKALELHAPNEGLGMKAWIQLAETVDGSGISELETTLEKLEASGKPLTGTAGQIRTVMQVLGLSGE